jgi:GNAT superfamily N-acetyltransferase
MSITQLEGFNVRPPRPEELPAITPWFEGSQLGVGQSMIRAAFSRPGEVPLGAYVVRPTAGGRVGQFTIFVRPDCRRHGIGRFLMMHLYQVAMGNNAEQLVLTELIHQDEPENAFCKAVGLLADMQLGTYELDIAGQVQPLCAPIARRFLRSHPHLQGVRVTTLAEVDAESVARFLTTYYSGFVEQQTERLRNGFFDPRISTVALKPDGTITGIALFLAKPNDPAIFLDLVLTEPSIRGGPTPVVLFDESTRQSLAQRKTTVVFEADARHDNFAIGFAARCGVTTPKWFRYRYSISREQMTQQR